MTADHIIEGTGTSEGRTYWECSCGRGGSSSLDIWDIHAEAHIPEGESWIYRWRGPQ